MGGFYFPYVFFKLKSYCMQPTSYKGYCLPINIPKLPSYNASTILPGFLYTDEYCIRSDQFVMTVF